MICWPLFPKLSHTQFSDQNLDMVIEDLPNITMIDISATKVADITPLRKIRHKLKTLIMYNIRSESGTNKEFSSVLSKLNELEFLDISDDQEPLSDTVLDECTDELLKHQRIFHEW